METDEDVLNFKDHNKWALNVVEALRDVRTSMTDEIADNVTRILRWVSLALQDKLIFNTGLTIQIWSKKIYKLTQKKTKKIERKI